jgi:hypothetical protein
MPGFGGRLFLIGGVVVEAGVVQLFEILAAGLPLGVGFEHAAVNQALPLHPHRLSRQLSLQFQLLHFLLSFLSYLSE